MLASLPSIRLQGRHSPSLHPSLSAGPCGCSIHICLVTWGPGGVPLLWLTGGFLWAELCPPSPNSCVEVLTSSTSEVIMLNRVVMVVAGVLRRRGNLGTNTGTLRILREDWGDAATSRSHQRLGERPKQTLPFTFRALLVLQGLDHGILASETERQ